MLMLLCLPSFVGIVDSVVVVVVVVVIVDSVVVAVVSSFSYSWDS